MSTQEHDELLQVQIKYIEQKVDILERDANEIKDTLDNIRIELSRYKGFVGGLMFIGSCMGVFLAIPREWFHRLFN